jgi:hypothetical protein
MTAEKKWKAAPMRMPPHDLKETPKLEHACGILVLVAHHRLRTALTPIYSGLAMGTRYAHAAAPPNYAPPTATARLRCTSLFVGVGVDPPRARMRRRRGEYMRALECGVRLRGKGKGM